MRDIKFRAWHEDKKQMRYGGTDVDFYTDPDGHDNMQDITRTFVPHPWPNHAGYVIEMYYQHDFLMSGENVFKGTVMQYTGLKDKNGKEIYELCELNNRYIVTYKTPRFCLYDITSGDIIDFDENHKYEITREYEALPQDPEGSVD